jgi:eukaryotic-like serine/threonine-protein kinase
MHDPQLAREALQGFEKDLEQVGSMSPDGERARMRAWVAMAEARYDDAVRELREADREYVIFDRRATVALAQAFDLAGRPDSALVYYEKFLQSQGGPPFIDGNFRAGAHKRAGELYETKGDTARAESNYAAFIELWKDADPELQPKVREVRERLTRLGRRKG